MPTRSHPENLDPAQNALALRQVNAMMDEIMGRMLRSTDKKESLQKEYVRLDGERRKLELAAMKHG